MKNDWNGICFGKWKRGGWEGVGVLITSPIKSATDVYYISHYLVKFDLINSIFTLFVHDSPVYHKNVFFHFKHIHVYYL